MNSSILAAVYTYSVQAHELPMLFYVGVLCVGLAVNAVVCFLLFTLQKAIPREHRRIEPSMIWLLMIPLFNLVWNFFVYQQIADSYTRVFASRGQPQRGGAERQLGLAFSICAACSVVPCLGALAALAALVLLITYLVKMFALKTELETGGGGGFPMHPQ